MATQAEEITNLGVAGPRDAWTDGVPAGEQRFGDPKFRRRLTDKILAAYNHAYGAGEADLAARLKSLLEEAESRELEWCERPGGSVLAKPIRRNSKAVHQARLWTRFVDSRRAFVALSIRRDSPQDRLRSAYLGMRNDFARWMLA